MKTVIKITLSLVTLWAASVHPASAAGRPVEFKLYTQNCYCFDESQTRTLKGITWVGNKLASAVGQGEKVKVTDLQRGIQKNTGTRRRELARQTIASGADVAFFQELWNADNKIDMINLLARDYRYYYITSKIRNGKTETDDGLLMVSKWPPFFTYAEEYKDRYDDEVYAHKGFLMMALNIPGGGFLVLINTHFQSGTDDTATAIRGKQIAQMVKSVNALKQTDWRLQNAKFLVGGDQNEPITFKFNDGSTYKAPSRTQMFDRSRSLVEWFNENGWNINNDQTIAKLCQIYKPTEVMEVHQVKKKGAFRQVDASRTVDKWAVKNMAPNDGWIGGPPGGMHYFPLATDPSGNQVLDHVFLDPSVATLQQMTVYRREVLGDKMDDGKTPYDPDTAISDHAGVLFRMILQPYNP